jgi:hypothetical protein
MFIDLIEDYREWSPPIGIRPIVEALVQSVPEKYLTGLKCIILTNTRAFNRSLRRKKVKHRGRKRSRVEANGIYQPAWPGHQAFIQLYVDNILAQYPTSWLRISCLRQLLFAETVFHEVGHHVHATKVREFGSAEDVADEWAQRLTARYFGRKYWYVLKLRKAMRIGSRYWNRRNRRRVEQALGADSPVSSLYS